MTRVFTIAAIAAILALGLFPGLLGPTSYAPAPYCGPTASFQPTFALADSQIAFLAESLSTDDGERIGRLEVKLDALRRRLAIPGFSAAIVRNQRVIWARGFGCANIASGTPATPHTPYHLASLTKPFGATILLSLVEEGLVNLDDPISDYGISLDSPGTIRVKHLLSHTSEGMPGSRYRYRGDRFGLISSVMDYARFYAAIDQHTFISEETQKMAWTPFVANNGRPLLYGYGWFIQERKGLHYIWHYGYWDCSSTLIVKVPERGLTFLIFANSDRLSSPFGLGAGKNVRRSPAARVFLDIFVESGR
jgi:CubicO group peptidase (beta-lactamase class C family)